MAFKDMAFKDMAFKDMAFKDVAAMTEILTRSAGLEVHEVPDGYIVYHGARDNVSYLNKTAAVIFELCDGKLEADDIVARVAKMFELTSSSHDEIRACMGSLIKEGLLQSISK